MQVLILISRRQRRRIGEADQQAHGVVFGKVASDGSNVGVELLLFGGVFHLPQPRLELIENVAVKAQVRAGEFIRKNGGSGKQAERGALFVGGRRDQQVGVAFKEGAGNAAINIAGEGNFAVIERDLNRLAVQRRFANPVNPPGIELGGSQL